eukprot:TRINITY_DN105132_c0_g1_i1.p1 TRINITY_DN105132_c0_g1~~TRINITY_DN105132_c0_g1_i1.p1  ORF type:complete len:305 (+),score=83.00 TRINITY_DN105132_c0_g1_i1:88-915(+)
MAMAFLAGTAAVLSQLRLGCSFIPVARGPSFSSTSSVSASAAEDTLKLSSAVLLLGIAPPAFAADLGSGMSSAGGVAESLGSVPPLGLLLLLSLAATWAELRPRSSASASSSHVANGSDNRFELRRQTLVALGLASSASVPSVVLAETPEEKKLRVQEENKAKEEERKAKKEQAEAERKAKQEKEEAERKARKEKQEQEAKAAKEKAAEEKKERERKAKESKDQEDKAKREAAEAEAQKKQQQQSGGGFNPLENVAQIFLGGLVAASLVPSKTKE